MQSISGRVVWLCRFSTAALAAIALAALAGWAFDQGALHTVLPGAVAMNPLTAVCFSLCAVSLAGWRGWGFGAAGRGVARACGTLVVLAGLLGIAGYCLGRNIGVDQLLFPAKLAAVPGQMPNRMAPNTACAFLLSGLALCCLDRRGSRGVLPYQLLALGTAFIGLVVLTGYVYRVGALYSVGTAIPMAPNTAAAFGFLTLAILTARPAEGLTHLLTSRSVGGEIARRLLPVAVLVPLILAFIRLEAQRRGLVGLEDAVAWLAVANITVLAGVIWWVACLLHTTDQERRASEEALQQSQRELEARVRERTAELEQANASLRGEIEKRQQAEGVLRESQALFSSFMDHSPALAFIRDAEGRLQYVNAAYERFFGVTIDELAGKPLPEVVPQETAARLRALYERVLAENRSLEVQETIPDPEGGLHECMFYLFPINEAGGGRYLGGMALDITDHQVLEGQLRQSQKMDAVGRLAGGVAHDFNNMLAVISGYSDILLTRLSPDDPARVPLEEVQKAAARATDLTRQLLAFSRQQVLAPKRLDLNEVALGMSKMLMRLIGEDVELVALPSPMPAPVVADPGQLEQVLMNLAVNARDAMPRGGKVTVEVRNVELDEGYVREHFDVRPGPYVRLTVSDTGCGMDRATLARIFEPFFTTKGAGQGTGLGLATVYGIVKQTGGDISVYSEPGCGTAFKIYLPRDVDAAAPVEGLAPGPEPLTGTETVLLVEDEQMVRQFVCSALQGYGYSVLEAPGGPEALRMCETYERPIHLLMTDVVMPGMSGRELAEQAASLRPEAKILFMSGYTDDAVVRHGVLHAEAEFIQKPFTPVGLGRKIREVLEAG